MTKKKNPVGRPKIGQKCSRCHTPLTDKNAYRRKDRGYYVDKCRDCNKDVQIVNKYMRLGEKSAREHIANYYRLIALIEEAIQRLNVKLDQQEYDEAIERAKAAGTA